MANKQIRRTKLALLAACAAIVSAPAMAQTRPAQQRYDIQAQDLGTALIELGRQANVEIYFSTEVTRGKRAPRLTGQMTLAEAIDRLLAGSGLVYRRNENGGFVIQATEAARVSEGAVASADSADIVVTGSLIRGVNPIAPVESYTREEIERTGTSTVEQFARRLTQNLGNTAGEASGGGAVAPSGGTTAANSSQTRGAAFNLRGLGSTATLTLINGRRVATAGLGGGFVDISLLPLAAIDRIDVLSDGASALYGSDAIGGVVNILLRRDFDGAESTLRYGFTARGGGEEFVASQLVGGSWGTGSMIAAYQFRKQSEIEISQRQYLVRNGNDTWQQPRQSSHQGYLRAAQQLFPTVEIYGQASFAVRNTQSFILTVTGFPSTINSDHKATIFTGDVGATIQFGRGWQLDLGATMSQNVEDTESLTIFTSTNTPRTTLVDTINTLQVIDAKVDGTLFTLPGGNLRAAFLVERRGDSLALKNRFAAGVRTPNSYSARNETAIAAEFYIPFVSSMNRTPGVEDLVVSIAGRYDRYSDFGNTFNPRLGALWSPVVGLRIRGTWSTAFRAPTLNQVVPERRYAVNDIPDPSAPDGITRTLVDLSSPSGLMPERARIWTIGAELRPVFARNLRAELNYYNILYEDRISGPPFPGGDYYNAYQLGAANLAFLIDRNPAVSVVQQILGCTDCTFFGERLPANTVEATLDTRTRNLSETIQDGIDFSLAGEAALLGGVGTYSLGGTYILRNRFTSVAGANAVDVLNKVSTPVDLRLNAAFGWRVGRFNSSININYVNGYRNDRFSPTEPIGSWLTGDLYLNYDFGPQGSLLSGMQVALAIQNVTNERVPFARSNLAGGPNYDPANASAVGRFVSFQVRKRF